MKKLYSLLLAGVMVFSLTACGGGEETAEQSAPQTTAAVQKEDNSGESGFAMPTLNSYDKFPSSDYWTALGLPSDFTIDITEMEFSSKNSIYPLDAKDGNMFDCVVSDNTAAYKALADSLWKGGIKGTSAEGTNITEAAERSEVDVKDIDEYIYKAYWLNKGELMSIEVRTRDGSRKVSVTVKYAPED